MNSWFVQHWPKSDTWNEEENILLQERLWKEGLIAIHYQNICSDDPEAYEPEYRKYIRKFALLAAEGGLVCANFPPIKKMFIGVVEPQSAITFDPAFHCLKLIKLKKCIPVSNGQRVRLLAGAPLRATLSRWKSIQNRLQQLIAGAITEEWSSLLPHEQETVCQEHMREHFGLRHLLLPFGRTLEDVDVYGVDARGQAVFAQVTFSDSRSVLRKKAEKLHAYKGSLYFYCPQSSAQKAVADTFPHIRFIDTAAVWNWLVTQKAYKKALFRNM